MIFLNCQIITWIPFYCKSLTNYFLLQQSVSMQFCTQVHCNGKKLQHTCKAASSSISRSSSNSLPAGKINQLYYLHTAEYEIQFCFVKLSTYRFQVCIMMYHTVQSAAEILIFINNIINMQYCVAQCTEQKCDASLFISKALCMASLWM